MPGIIKPEASLPDPSVPYIAVPAALDAPLPTADKPRPVARPAAIAPRPAALAPVPIA